MNDHRYAGFWIRTVASIMDTFLLMSVTLFLLWIVYGNDYFIGLTSETAPLFYGPLDMIIQNLFPIIIVLLFWIYRSATPGKMAVKLVIVDAKTGGKPSVGQYIGRYFSYILSTIPLGLGFIWIAFDSKKQGWHDKLAGTVVIKTKSP